MKDQNNTDVKIIFALTLVHFIGDFYSSFINPLLPVFVEKFSLTLAQVGILVGISRLMAFIVQPVAGYVADHYRTRFFILGGLLFPIIFISLLGAAPSFSANPLCTIELRAFIAIWSVIPIECEMSKAVACSISKRLMKAFFTRSFMSVAASIVSKFR